MPSTLQVDKIIDGSATTNKEIAEYASGNWSWGSGVPAGSVLQVKSTTKIDAFSTQSANPTDVTGLSVDITPASTSNKILVTVSLNFSGSTNLYANGFVLRGSQVITTSTAVSLSNQINASFGVSTDGSDGQYKIYSLAFNHLDSPSSTSSLTYKIQIGTHNSAYFYLNRALDNGNHGYVVGGVSSITVMEIAG